jgi:transposase InsO family protein
VWADLISRWGSIHAELWEKDRVECELQRPEYDVYGEPLPGTSMREKLDAVAALEAAGEDVPEELLEAVRPKVLPAVNAVSPGTAFGVTELGDAAEYRYLPVDEVEATVPQFSSATAFNPANWMALTGPDRQWPKWDVILRAQQFAVSKDSLPPASYVRATSGPHVGYYVRMGRPGGRTKLAAAPPSTDAEPGEDVVEDSEPEESEVEDSDSDEEEPDEGDELARPALVARVWIPAVDDLRVRITVIAHGGAAGHRGWQATLASIREWFIWPGMQKDVKDLCTKCLHCLPVRGGRRIPRPMATAGHATEPNQMIHFDWLYMGEELEDDDSAKYVLCLKDDWSGFTELVWSATATADVVVKHLDAWFSRFGVVLNWVSDQGTHFTAAVMKELARKMGAEHHYVVAYAPWANGTVERVNRDLLATMRALRLERPGVLWKDLLSMVQSSINQTVSVRKGGYAPVTIMTGLKPTTPLSAFYKDEENLAGNVKPTGAAYKVAVEKLTKRLRNMHGVVKSMRAKMHDKSLATAGTPVNFGPGDYVMLARATQGAGRKLLATWRGPMEVVENLRHLVYVVRNLVGDTHYKVHANRLKFYCDSSLGLSAEVLEAAANMADGVEVEAIVGYDLEYSDGPRLRIQWRGLMEPSWEPLSIINEDIPKMVEKYLERVSLQAVGDKTARWECGRLYEAVHKRDPRAPQGGARRPKENAKEHKARVQKQNDAKKRRGRKERAKAAKAKAAAKAAKVKAAAAKRGAKNGGGKAQSRKGKPSSA